MADEPSKTMFETACGAGHARSTLSPWKELVVSALGGALLAFGGLLSIVVGGGNPELVRANPGLASLVFGGVFPVGMVLVILTGAQVFTDNCGLVTPAWLVGATRWWVLLRNWAIVYVGNFIGAVLVALFLAYWSGVANVSADGVAQLAGSAAVEIAEAKVGLNWGTLVLRGLGGNWLVCLAVWLALSAKSISGKVLGVWVPIATFVALGLEHSVANMFFIPLGMLNGANVSVGQFLFGNLLPVTIGNIVGGAGFVAAIYWWLYGRD